MQTRLILALVCIGAGLIGCDRKEDVSTYVAPKEEPREMTVMPHGTPPQAAEEEAGIQWKLPAGWKVLPTTSSMQYAILGVTDDNPPVTLTVIPLGLEAGNVLANVNRWEQQLGSPPTPESDLGKVVKHETVGGVAAEVVDLMGPEPGAGQVRKRMLGAIVHHPQRVWFLKMVGPAEKVGAQKANFEAFVQSVQFPTSAEGGGSR